MIYNIMQVVTTIIRILLSMIFFRAALHKMRYYHQFESELKAYQLIPESLLSASVILLACTEVFVSVTLLNPHWFFPCAISATLFLFYGFAMAINLQKGRTHIGCGCSGPLFSSTNAARKIISWALVIRNIGLMSLALISTLTIDSNNSLNKIDYSSIVFGSIVSLLLYEAIEQAIANQQTMNTWRKQAVKI